MGGGGLGAPVPAWLVVFASGLGLALGYCLALFNNVSLYSFFVIDNSICQLSAHLFTQAFQQCECIFPFFV